MRGSVLWRALARRDTALVRAAAAAAAAAPGAAAAELGAAQIGLRALVSAARDLPRFYASAGARSFGSAAEPSGAAHPTELGEAQFHRLADAALERALEALEALVDEADLPGADAELGQGVLTLRLGALGTYVLNKQGPNRQLWLSSPVSGPFRYDYNGGAWVYRRDGHALHAKLEAELEALTGIAVDLNPCTGCERLGTCVEADRCEKPEGAAGT